MVFRQFSFHSIGWCVWWMQIAWKWRTTQFNRNKTIITVHSSQVGDESQGRKDTTFSNRNGTMERSESDSICVNTVSLTLSNMSWYLFKNLLHSHAQSVGDRAQRYNIFIDKSFEWELASNSSSKTIHACFHRKRILIIRFPLNKTQFSWYVNSEDQNKKTLTRTC